MRHVKPSPRLLLVALALCPGCGTNAVSPPGGATGERTAARRAAVKVDVPPPVVFAPTIDSTRPDDWFDDATERSGIRFTHRNGREAGRFFIIESFGGGVAMLDFDRDGDVDLFFTGGGTISSAPPVKIAGLPSALYCNAGEGRFEDVTEPGGFAESPEYSQGCAVTDFDVDGFPDLFVCCYGRSRLYRNQGDGTYAEPLDEVKLPAHGWGTAAAFGDADRDGFPDLFLARYAEWSPERDVECRNSAGVRDLCGPSSYPGTTCKFFHNVGDGRFEDWSDLVGLAGNVRGLGVAAADFNGDGWVDFYVASDESPKHLYLGGPELRFTEVAMSAGVAVGELGQAEGSMGIEVGDYNGDGLPDIFVTNFENEDAALYRNLGDGLFLHSTATSGLAGRFRRRVGFGTALVDFDGDGWLDLFVLNGNPIYTTAETPYKQAPQLFRNLEGRRFENISEHGGTYFREEHSGRGDAAGDLDNDGAPDLALVLMNEPVRVLGDRLAPKNFVSVELRARQGEPDATGARVTAEFEGRRLVRFAARGTGFFSQSDPRMIFPAASDAMTVAVTVDWPGRGRATFGRLAVRKRHLLIEGRGNGAHD